MKIQYLAKINKGGSSLTIMVEELHEVWVNADASFDCESHSIKGEKCIDELRKILAGLAVIENFNPKPEFQDNRDGKRKRKSSKKQHRGRKK